jgi:ERO1-like protein alpha
MTSTAGPSRVESLDRHNAGPGLDDEQGLFEALLRGLLAMAAPCRGGRAWLRRPRSLRLSPPPLLLLLLLLLCTRVGGLVTTDSYGFQMPWEKVTGAVADCCASVDDVQRNHSEVDRLLRLIVEKPFFRIFKVNLERPCRFFPDDGTCGRESCAVSECCEDEIPEPWRSGAPSTCAATPRRRGKGLGCLPSENDVDFTLLTSFHGFDTYDSADVSIVQNAGYPSAGNASVGSPTSTPWAPPSLSSRDVAMAYVNLQHNPERYTGYVGPTATRIWDAIYEENCFEEKDGGGHCFEERVFFRLMSGLHTSINTHLSRHFYPDDSPNLLLWQHKVGMHPERIENLYFTFLLITRAVALSLPHLTEFEYDTGDPSNDVEVARLLEELAELPIFQPHVPCFDETALFKPAGHGGVGLEGRGTQLKLKNDFVQHFRNISLILDCVTCEKCKLWGKLQVLGIGTALKVLMSEGAGAPYDLERNEIIAMFNTLSKLSQSIQTISFMSALLEDPMGAKPGRILDAR